MPKTNELSQFERDLLESVRQAKDGENTRVHTPDEIQARRRGRPASSIAAVRKVPTTIRFDPDVLEGLRATGRGWQTRANDALRDWLKAHQP
ncbi:BrnA antitoxin family protein [Castellaniella sp.]|uniref:BrnA antitoxin family protein n=1 Tax=Castellaniella sp. TaxID=1955812 RepID=UPI00355FF360